jgi:transposase
VEEAQRIGQYTGQLVEATLATKRHPEQGYRSCLGILRLAKTYPTDRMEAAARRALRARAYSSRSMESILRNQLDRLPVPGERDIHSAVEHANIRGAGYFDAVQ